MSTNNAIGIASASQPSANNTVRVTTILKSHKLTRQCIVSEVNEMLSQRQKWNIFMPLKQRRYIVRTVLSKSSYLIAR
ncbi:hypothetical protein H6F76_03545 [Leptolyngbya sp. FACHB-321]|nr:hypothetical protein [Leptolyngbya sp. FACHB-321]